MNHISGVFRLKAGMFPKFGKLLSVCAFIALTACNPCKRISRIAERHPECFKALNETKRDTGSVRIADRDSSIAKGDSALTGLADTVFKYITVIQDCNSTPEQKDSATIRIFRTVQKAKSAVKEIITTAPCLTDTVTFTDKSGSILKLWQQGKDIKYSLSYPHINYELKEKDWPWWAWLCIGYGLAIATYVIMIIRSKN